MRAGCGGGRGEITRSAQRGSTECRGKKVTLQQCSKNRKQLLSPYRILGRGFNTYNNVIGERERERERERKRESSAYNNHRA